MIRLNFNVASLIKTSEAIGEQCKVVQVASPFENLPEIRIGFCEEGYAEDVIPENNLDFLVKKNYNNELEFYAKDSDDEATQERNKDESLSFHFK